MLVQFIVHLQVDRSFPLLDRIGRLLESLLAVVGARSEQTTLIRLVRFEVNLLRHDGRLVLKHLFA